MTTTTINSNTQLKNKARQNLKGNWLPAVLVYLILPAIGAVANFIPRIGPIINFIIGGPLILGIVTCFLDLVRNNNFQIEKLFDGFSNFKSAFLVHILKFIFITLWSLLAILGMIIFYQLTIPLYWGLPLIIPGIIAYYRYSMAFYILHDNPDLGAKEAIDKSKQMMAGHKKQLFFLHLSLIGWAILSILTLGIGFLWLMAYKTAAEINFYEELKETQETKTEVKSDTEAKPDMETELETNLNSKAES